MVRRKIISIVFMLFCIQTCFSQIQIHHKKELFSREEIGSMNNLNFSTDGYYYTIKTDTLYHKADLQRDGIYNKEKNYYYPLKYLRCLFFSKDGFVIQKDFTTPYVQNQDSVKYYNQNIISIFEKKLASENIVEGLVKKDKLWFLNKKAQIWKNGIYKLDKDSIKMQMYNNLMGDYYLIEYKGQYHLNKIVFTEEYAYREKKKHTDTIVYEFKKLGKEFPISNYIRENSKKFWK